MNGQWELNQDFKELCSESNKCPAGSYCRSRFEMAEKLENPNLWVDTDFKEFNWGFTNFDNIGYASITLMQVTTLDGWT